MNRIEKSKGRLKSRATLIAGSLFLITGILSIIDHSYLLAVLYILLGATGIFVGINDRNIDKEFIAWNSDSLSIKDSSIHVEYAWDEIDEIYIDQGHLKIKSGRANGIMIDLKDYSKNDLQTLNDQLLVHKENFQILNG